MKQRDRSIDVRDICYFIDHVKDINFRVSLIQELGYRVGVDFATKECKEKDIVIGKRKEWRLQIEPREEKFTWVRCAIIE